MFDALDTYPPDDEELVRHFREAGFVDISVITRPLDFGDWRRGLHSLQADVY